jgi:hypothetical protein
VILQKSQPTTTTTTTTTEKLALQTNTRYENRRITIMKTQKTYQTMTTGVWLCEAETHWHVTRLSKRAAAAVLMSRSIVVMCCRRATPTTTGTAVGRIGTSHLQRQQFVEQKRALSVCAQQQRFSCQ